jgi:hypothetical protein
MATTTTPAPVVDLTRVRPPQIIDSRTPPPERHRCGCLVPNVALYGHRDDCRGSVTDART